jgi:hypothetical protein
MSHGATEPCWGPGPSATDGDMERHVRDGVKRRRGSAGLLELMVATPQKRSMGATASGTIEAPMRQLRLLMAWLENGCNR